MSSEPCKKIIFFIFIGFISLFAGCQNLVLERINTSPQDSDNNPAILNWAECAELAQKEHPKLKVAQETLRQAQLDWRKAFASFLPDASGSFDRKRRKAGSADPDDLMTLSLTASEEWFSGFGNAGELLRARRAYKAQNFSYMDTQSDVASNLRSAYINLMHAQELVVLRKMIAERRKVNRDIVRLRYDAGREHRGSLKRAEAIYNEAEFDVREAERQIVIQRNKLARELGGQFENTLAVSGELELMIPSKPLAEPNFSDLVEKVPAVEEQKELSDAAGATVIKEQAAFWPTVTGSTNYSRTGRNVLMDSESWDFGFRVNAPLFSGGENLNNFISARSGHREAFYNLKDKRNSAYTDLVEKWLGLISAIEEVEVRKKFVEASTERAEISSLQYQDGLSSFVDWDSIEQELVSSRISLLNIQRDASLAEANWMRSQGLSFDAYRS